MRFRFPRGRITQLSSHDCLQTAWQGSEKTCRVLLRYKIASDSLCFPLGLWAIMTCFSLSLVLFIAVILRVGYSLPLNGTLTLEPRTTHTGEGTWFEVGLGNCGYRNVNSEKIVAVSLGMYYDSDKCGQYVRITNAADGRSVYAMTRDSCVGCRYYDLDMSPAAFEALAPLSVGRIQISWNFMHKGWFPE